MFALARTHAFCCQHLFSCNQ